MLGVAIYPGDPRSLPAGLLAIMAIMAITRRRYQRLQEPRQATGGHRPHHAAEPYRAVLSTIRGQGAWSCTRAVSLFWVSRPTAHRPPAERPTAMSADGGSPVTSDVETMTTSA